MKISQRSSDSSFLNSYSSITTTYSTYIQNVHPDFDPYREQISITESQTHMIYERHINLRTDVVSSSHYNHLFTSALNISEIRSPRATELSRNLQKEERLINESTRSVVHPTPLNRRRQVKSTLASHDYKHNGCSSFTNNQKYLAKARTETKSHRHNPCVNTACRSMKQKTVPKRSMYSHMKKASCNNSPLRRSPGYENLPNAVKLESNFIPQTYTKHKHSPRNCDISPLVTNQPGRNNLSKEQGFREQTLKSDQHNSDMKSGSNNDNGNYDLYKRDNCDVCMDNKQIIKDQHLEKRNTNNGQAKYIRNTALTKPRYYASEFGCINSSANMSKGKMSEHTGMMCSNLSTAAATKSAKSKALDNQAFAYILNSRKQLKTDESKTDFDSQEEKANSNPANFVPQLNGVYRPKSSNVESNTKCIVLNMNSNCNKIETDKYSDNCHLKGSSYYSKKEPSQNINSCEQETSGKEKYVCKLKRSKPVTVKPKIYARIRPRPIGKSPSPAKCSYRSFYRNTSLYDFRSPLTSSEENEVSSSEGMIPTDSDTTQFMEKPMCRVATVTNGFKKSTNKSYKARRMLRKRLSQFLKQDDNDISVLAIL